MDVIGDLRSSIPSGISLLPPNSSPTDDNFPPLPSLSSLSQLPPLPSLSSLSQLPPLPALHAHDQAMGSSHSNLPSISDPSSTLNGKKRKSAGSSVLLLSPPKPILIGSRSDASQPGKIKAKFNPADQSSLPTFEELGNDPELALPQFKQGVFWNMLQTTSMPVKELKALAEKHGKLSFSSSI